ncbi:MAG TPA: BolA/IbaG family iron-sulfur metabolism protein [Steroidobacteraceae bacterium]|jgi:acid stress-induced BolA-like protein IbaG/YrbA|nr:BolA/IbaG family iron-sulfur metabolism protein [Steroidobacteraceae bacterium]
MTPQQIAELIRAALPRSQVDVRSDDNTHFSARLIGPEFAGLKPLARHQLVYRALGARMGNEIHALTIEAFTPQEWAARAQSGGSPQSG